MRTKQHAIITACDAKCGDFLAQHWLPSLRDHVTLDQIDVIVLDYGLTAKQRAAVDQQGAMRRCLPRDGFVNNLRFRDLAAVVAEARYDQVMVIDPGDVIFQTDIRELFEQDQWAFRAVCEEYYTAQYEHFICRSDFEPEQYAKMVQFLRGTSIINSGMLLGPGHLFVKLWPAMQSLVRDMQNWGTLQLVINYLFYQSGFVQLPYRYNFILMTARSPYRIWNGQFFDSDGKLIPVVHNAGGTNALRFIRKFGYGPNRNIPRILTPTVIQLFFRFIRAWKGDRMHRRTVVAEEHAA